MAMVAMEKKMPRRRSVSSPTPRPSSPAVAAPARICSRQRQRERLVERHRGVGADREEGARAEIHVAGEAAEDVPGGGEHDELQHHVAGEEVVLVLRRTAAAPRRARAATAAPTERSATDHRVASRSTPEQARPGARRARAAGCRRPPPAPRRCPRWSARSTRRRRGSARPPACRSCCPGPPARRRRRCGRCRGGRGSGSTGPMMISSAPASAQVAVAMPKAQRLMRTGSAPISRSAPSSCATALIARPVKVRDRYSVSAAVSASATPNATSMRFGHAHVAEARSWCRCRRASTSRWSTPKTRISADLAR